MKLNGSVVKEEVVVEGNVFAPNETIFLDD